MVREAGGGEDTLGDRFEAPRMTRPRHSGTELLLNESRPIRYIRVVFREILQSAKSKHG